jgi:hypothetical protein
MKLKIINFILWIYLIYIKEDWTDFTKIGKLFCYPAWIIQSIIIWVLSPLLIPVYATMNSKTYKTFQKQLKNN